MNTLKETDLHDVDYKLLYNCKDRTKMLNINFFHAIDPRDKAGILLLVNQVNNEITSTIHANFIDKRNFSHLA